MHQFTKLWTVFFVGNLVLSSLGCSGQSKAAGDNTVEAILQVSFSRHEIFPSKLSQNTVGTFEVFTNTQVALLKSSFVLRSALVRREIASLEVVQSHDSDPVRWLRNALKVGHPKNTELIMLRLTDSGDVKQLRKVLDAVILAYQREVITPRRIREFEDHESFKKYYKNISNEYKESLDKFHVLSSELNADGESVYSSSLEILKLELKVQRDFLKEIAREKIVNSMNADLGDSRVRIVQMATVVKD